MRKIIVLIVLTALLSIMWAEQSRSIATDVNYANIYTGTILEQVNTRLRQIGQISSADLGTDSAARAQQLLQEVYALLELIPADIDLTADKTGYIATPDPNPPVGSANGNSRLKPRLTPVPDRYPITPPEYESLQGSLSREPFRRGKLAILDNAAQSYRFSINQIMGLLLALDYSSDRLAALPVIFPNSTDPQNKYKLLEVFKTISDKDQATYLMRD